MPRRERSSVSIAILNPSPSSPSRFSTGTRTSSKVSSAVGEPRIPILCSTRGAAKPGVSASTMKALIPLRPPASGSVRAKTVSRFATLPWVMKRLLPLRTYSSPSRTARIRLAATSLPAAASVSAKAASHSPEARRGKYRSFCSSLPARMIGSAPSFWTMGMSEVVASARAISSTRMDCAIVSSAVPP
jgi:hypothetical protein